LPVTLPETIVRRRCAALVPYARNARTHSDQQVAQIAASIREFGFTNPALSRKLDRERGVPCRMSRWLRSRTAVVASRPRSSSTRSGCISASPHRCARAVDPAVVPTFGGPPKLGRSRDRQFVDSLLEESEFEPLVPLTHSAANAGERRAVRGEGPQKSPAIKQMRCHGSRSATYCPIGPGP
jgi:hypothetical protein